MLNPRRKQRMFQIKKGSVISIPSQTPFLISGFDPLRRINDKIIFLPLSEFSTCAD